MHYKIYIVFMLFVIEFMSVLAPNLRGQPLFLDFFEKNFWFSTTFVIYVLTKYQLIKRYRSKRIKVLDKNSYPIFVPRRAPRNGATGIKQLHAAQLQTIVYLSWKFDIHISYGFRVYSCTKWVVKNYKMADNSVPEVITKKITKNGSSLEHPQTSVKKWLKSVE